MTDEQIKEYNNMKKGILMLKKTMEYYIEQADNDRSNIHSANVLQHGIKIFAVQILKSIGDNEFILHKNHPDNICNVLKEKSDDK